MGNVLRGCFRGDDIVGRIGGDEFMVLVRNIREESSLGEIVERIQSDIRGNFRAAPGAEDSAAVWAWPS
jgi:GGDEF domain-containing protein